MSARDEFPLESQSVTIGGIVERVPFFPRYSDAMDRIDALTAEKAGLLASIEECEATTFKRERDELPDGLHGLFRSATEPYP